MSPLHTPRFGAWRGHVLVAPSILLMAALTILPALPTGAGAAGSPGARSHSPKSRLSGGVLTARAIHSGQVQPTSAPTAATSTSSAPTCSPAPCALPNVQVSQGKKPVNEDPIAANPVNAQDLLSGGNDYNCSSLLGFFASSNGGTSWSHTCMNTPSDFSVGCGDPGVGYDLSGAAYITGIASSSSYCTPGEVIFEKSTDNGQKWSAPAAAVPALFSGGVPDKPWLQVDDTAGSPHAGGLYISATQFDSSESDTEISVSHSTNGGASWSTTAVDKVQLDPSVDQFSDLAIGKDGTVYVSWLRCTSVYPPGGCAGTQVTLLLSRSTDGGNTWSTPVTIATPTLAPDPRGCCFFGELPNTTERVSEIPSIGIDNSSGPHAGSLYAAFYTWTGSSMKVEVASSTTGGSSWSTPVLVAPPGDPQDQFFPWLSVNSGGLVGVTWLDRRYDPTNLSYEAFAAISSDGGASFPDLPIASAPSNPENDGFKGTFMGDYAGNVWNSTGTTLYASWMDSRNGSNMQDEVGGRVGAGSVPAWNISTSPNVGSSSNQLNGVAAVSASNVWAVGYAYPSYSTGVSQTLAEQWNGTGWTVVPSPNVGTLSNSLQAVAAVSASDVWAVGYSHTSSSGTQSVQTLIEHWNGSSWSVVSSPNVGSDDVLNGVAAVSSTDVWAVGYANNESQTLVEHWNGTGWSVVDSPNPGIQPLSLNGIAVVSGSDIWAVGVSGTSTINQTLVEHWNGTTWKVVSSPNVGTSTNLLNGVSDVSSTDVWAVGVYFTSGGVQQTLTEQWNGSTWSVVPSANADAATSSGDQLSAVAAVSANDIWAVGNTFNTVYSNFETLAEHWNGTSWSVVPSLSEGTGTVGNNLLGLAAITSNNVWTAGYEINSSSVSQTLIEQYCC